MFRNPLKFFNLPAIALFLASFGLAIPCANGAASYAVQDYGLAYLNQVEIANLFGQDLLTFKDGEMVLRGDPSSSSPAPPDGMGRIMAGAFTSPDGAWRVGTAFASPVGQSAWRGYVQPVSGPGERILSPSTNLDGAFTSAFAVNDSGVAVGAASASTSSFGQAARFNPDGTTTLLGTAGQALGISNSGLIVGTTANAFGGHGFLYDSGTVLDLNRVVSPNLGLDILTATDVFDDGRIVAFGKDASGQYHELLLTPDPDSSTVVNVDPVATDSQTVPEPASALVFGVLAVAALSLRRRTGRNVR